MATLLRGALPARNWGQSNNTEIIRAVYSALEL